jgi:hypothetical protein
MEIGDDVAPGIPDKTGAGSLRYLIKIQSKQIALDSDGGDVDDRRRGLLEKPDG